MAENGERILTQAAIVGELMKADFDYYQALKAKDARFDGQFFVAVKTTKIYCRPICPARLPLRASCLFVETAAAAERAGFRPCLRCRPELAPGTLAVSLEEALFGAIRAQAIQGSSVDEIAKHAGFSSRQLRRLMVQAFGVTPIEIVQTERLLFAKKLLQETTLKISEIAMSAGFGSLRRFNALFLKRYGQAPTLFRRPSRLCAAESADVLRLRLSYRPPLAWNVLLEYLSRRAVPGVEAVSMKERIYSRSVACAEHLGWLSVCHSPDGEWLDVTLPASLAEVSWNILSRLRTLFDLDANPASVDALLGVDSLLGPSVRRHPGMRVPGAWSTFELAVRAILGQQVSVAGASTLAARLAAKFGKIITTPLPQIVRLAPSASDLAVATPEEIGTIGLPKARALALHELAKAAERNELTFGPAIPVGEAIASMCRIRGIGEWTAQYIAMRALRFPDAFPAGDLGVRKALSERGQPLRSEKQVIERAAGWRPWRAYATLHLWQTLQDAPLSSSE